MHFRPKFDLFMSPSKTISRPSFTIMKFKSLKMLISANSKIYIKLETEKMKRNELWNKSCLHFVLFLNKRKYKFKFEYFSWVAECNSTRTKNIQI